MVGSFVVEFGSFVDGVLTNRCGGLEHLRELLDRLVVDHRVSNRNRRFVRDQALNVRVLDVTAGVRLAGDITRHLKTECNWVDW